MPIEMQKNEMKLLLYCLIICLITGLSVAWWVSSQQKKIAVVDAVKLFNGYEMKKELEGIDKVKLQAESKEIDSIGNALQMEKAKASDADLIKKLEYGYSYMRNKLEKDYEQSNHELNEKVWKRLNPLLTEFGKKNGLHLIIGANGMGSVLYNDDHYDLTNEAIKFINQQYAKGN